MATVLNIEKVYIFAIVWLIGTKFGMVMDIGPLNRTSSKNVEETSVSHLIVA